MRPLTDRKICVAKITSAHGIQGHVKVVSYTDDPMQLFSYASLVTQDHQALQLKKLRAVSTTSFICHLANIQNRTDAERYAGTLLFVDRADLPDLPPTHVYYEDLVGLKVISHPQPDLSYGCIKGVFNFGAGTFIEVFDEKTDQTYTLPFHSEAIKNIAWDEGCVSVDPHFLLS